MSHTVPYCIIVRMTSTNSPNDFFEQVLDYHGLQRRPEQDKLVHLLYSRDRWQTSFTQAGTGVGKSLALITDALRIARQHGRPAIIVTPTNKLLHQYVTTDLPMVSEAIGDVHYMRLMGRTHYACADSDRGLSPSAEMPDRMDWLSRLTDDRPAWQSIDTDELQSATEYERAPSGLSDQYACPGYPDCSGTELGGCGAKLARKRAQFADIIVTNGHVLAIDQLMRERGMKLLPDAAVIHVDEAHTLPSVVRDCRTATLDRSTGSKTFRPRDEESPDADRVRALSESVQNLIASALKSVRWENQYQSDFLLKYLSRRNHRPIADEIDWYVQSEHYSRTEREDDVGRVVDTLRTAIRGDRGYTTIVTRDDPNTIQLVPVSAAERPLSAIRGAAVSATIPESLPAMYGQPDAPIHDVGHPFDYATQVAGYVSQHSGVKSGSREWFQSTYLPRQAARLDELSALLGTDPSLVLCSSHSDVKNVAQGLANRGHQVFNPQGSGSSAAQVAEKAFRQSVAYFVQSPVLVGTDTYATGMDLPGDLLTRVAWWTVPYGASTELDKQIDRRYRGARRDWLRVKVTQGCGRLIRKHSDQGTIILCDERFVSDYRVNATRHVTDRHLTAIDWEWID